MGIFSKTKNKTVSSSEVGVYGDVVFSGLDQEEHRADNVSTREYRDMLDKDPTLESLYKISTLPVIASSFRIDPNPNDKNEVQAEFIRKALFTPPHEGGMESPFSLFIDQLLLSLVDGFQVWEKIYKIHDDMIVYSKLSIRESSTVTLIRDKHGGYSGIRQVASYGDKSVDVKIPADKTFLFTYDKSRDYLYGRSAFRSLRKPYLKKSKLEYLDSIALQADAIKPKLLIQTEKKMQNEDSVIKKGLRMLSKLGELKSAGSIPHGYDIKELNTEGRDPHQSIERQNSEMARAFLASFSLLGSQGGSNTGSYALSSSLSDLMMVSLQAFMTKIEEHINQYLVADLIELNYSEPLYPIFKFEKVNTRTAEIMKDAFMKLLEKDKISDDFVAGIQDTVSAQLGISVNTEIDPIVKSKKDKDGGDASNGDKFLGDKIDLEQKNVLSVKPLTDAEKNVRIEKIAEWLDRAESEFATSQKIELEAYLKDFGKNIKQDVKLPKSYTKLLEKYFKDSYNYGKLTASEEAGNPAPITKDQFTIRMKQIVGVIHDMQEVDIRNIATQVLNNGEITLDDGIDDKNSELFDKLSSELVNTAVNGTLGSLIGTAFSNGREDAHVYFDKNTKNDVRYQWSSVLESRSCFVCRALDGRVLDAEEKRNTIHNPQKHINCKCLWIRIEAKSDSYKLPKKTERITDDKVSSVEYIQKTPKSVLVDENPELAKYTKKELEAVEWYKGSGYVPINNSLLQKIPSYELVEGVIPQIDKAIKRDQFKEDTYLWRGIGSDRKLEVGSIVKHPNFTSSTISEYVALAFAENSNKKYRYVMRFVAPKGSPHMQIEKHIDTLHIEDEHLLSRGKEFFVKQISKEENGIIYIDVELTEETKMLSEEKYKSIDFSKIYKKYQEDKRISPDKYDPNANQQLARLFWIWQAESDYLVSNMLKV